MTSTTTSQQKNKLRMSTETAVPGEIAAARVAIWAAAACLAIVAILHVVEPELAPSWRLMSEYANGEVGWLMPLAFLSLATANIATAVVLLGHARTLMGRIGIALVAIAALAMIVAAFNPMDPLLSKPEELTPEGNMHGLAAMVGNSALPIGAVLITYTLGKNAAWADVRPSVRWSGHFVWISLAVLFAVLLVTLPANGGAFGPEVPVGWPNRLMFIAYCAWPIVLGRSAIKIRSTA